MKAVRRVTAFGERRSRPRAEPSPLAALLRRHDRERFQTALFAPAARREALFALYAFNWEIARVRERVSEPTLGRIRLEWWREVVDAAYTKGPTRRHEVVVPLTRAIRECALTRAHFLRLIEAREQDLSDEPPADLAALEAYADASSAPLVALALEALGVREDAAGEAGRHVGIAYALAGLLRAMPFRAAGRPPGIPVDRAAETADAAARHLAAARALRPRLPRAASPALLPAVIAARFLARLEAAGHDPFAAALARPDPLQIWRLAAAAALGGRF